MVHSSPCGLSPLQHDAISNHDDLWYYCKSVRSGDSADADGRPTILIGYQSRPGYRPKPYVNSLSPCDLDRGVVRPNTSVLVRGGYIQAVDANELRGASDVTTVDLRGKYVLPGLINTHVHLAVGKPDPVLARAYLRRELYSGVTTVRDMADDARMLGELKREATFDEIESPDIYYVALMAGPSFFSDPRSREASLGFEPGTAPWLRAVTENSDLRQIIAEARGTGATAIKIYADLAPALVSALTAEAHRQGLLVWAHAAVFPAGPMDVIRSGVDVVSHADFLAYQLAPKLPASFAEMSPLSEHGDFDGPVLRAVYQEMKDRGTILDATVDVTYRHPSKNFPPSVVGAVTAAAHRHGVMVSAGTDDDPDWSDPDSALVGEIARLVESAGFTPMDALKAATTVGARTIGQQNAVGKFESGYAADFVVLRDNPLDSIQNLHSVEIVVKHGIPHLRKTYEPFRINSTTSKTPNQ
jgi:imidazolonepropionase-like amidohydrolase